MPAQTSQKTTEQLTRDAFADLTNRDLSRAAEIWGPDSVDDFVAVGVYRGTEEIKGFFAGIFSAVPDFTIEVDRILVDGDVATVQWRARGTFTGTPFLDIEATGKPIDFRGVDVMEWRDGVIAENTIYYDGAEFARQIGLLPPRDSAADRGMLKAFNAFTKLRAKAGR
jgi:steroid delta-isomerase-like uncharacterized protein